MAISAKASYTESTAPEYWLMGCVPGDDEPVLLETGTKQECELMRDSYLQEETGTEYAELFILAVVGYAATLPLTPDYQE